MLVAPVSISCEVHDVFLFPEQMIPASAPPTPLGPAKSIANPPLPADSSKPGRATKTQASMSMLGRRPNKAPIAAAPSLPKRPDSHTTAPTTTKPQIVSSAIHLRSPLSHPRWFPPKATAAKTVPITHVSHTQKATKYRVKDDILRNCTVGCPMNGRKIPISLAVIPGAHPGQRTRNGAGLLSVALSLANGPAALPTLTTSM
jgi:hypothetical protein